ncbi:kinase-like protein [Ceratobasidium sp. AG-I]|nr:kinase-like protein [Ceratobasidium sp. AG-I]
MAEEEEIKLTFWGGACIMAEMISEGASHLYTAFTTPPPQPTPRQPTILDRTFPQELLGGQPGQPGIYRYEAPVREPPRLQLPEQPPPPPERPLSPLGNIPGGWDADDEVDDPAAKGEDIVERADDITTQGVQNVHIVSSNSEVSVERQNDGLGLGQAGRITNVTSPSTSNTVLPNVQSKAPQLEDDNSATPIGLSNPRGSASSDAHTIPLVVEPPPSSATQSPPGPSIATHQTGENEDDLISGHSRHNSQDHASTRSASPYSTLSTRNNALQVPATRNNLVSDDHSSISSFGGTSSTQGSSTPKKSKMKRIGSATRRFFGKGKPSPEAPLAGGSIQPQSPKPSVTTSSTPTTPTVRPQPDVWPTVDTNNPAFIQAARHCITTFAELNKQLAPLPYLCDLLGPFEKLFEAIEMARTNKKQWLVLQKRCVTGTLLISSQIKQVQADEERHKSMYAVCQEVADVVNDIATSAVRWNGMHKIQSFVLYRQMSEEIERFFGRLDSALKVFSIGSKILAEQWTGEFARVQKEETQQLQELLVLAQDGNSNIETVIAGQNMTHSAIRKIERRLDSVLKENWELGQQSSGIQKRNVQLTIGLILQVAGLSMPVEVFHGKACTNVLEEPIARGATCNVYHAKLGDEEVAKKVFYMEHTAEKTIEAYAKKISRDAQLWASFNSDFILKFYGVGMEQIEGSPNKFKLYMLSPMLPNSDAITYLQTRRATIGNRKILRIVMDAAHGLKYLHRNGVIHSGMRGENILIRADGQGVLGGFGLTKALENRKVEDELPDVAMTGPTWCERWMAPELFKFSGSPRATKASDVWGWAMATLEIVTGRIPFHTTDRPQMVIPKILMDPRTSRNDYPEFTIFAHQPDTLWALLERCWDLEPKKRPTIDEIQEELARIDAL